jgi:hypothetical protein
MHSFARSASNIAVILTVILCQLASAQPKDSIDVFPLSPGVKYTYHYQYQYWAYWAGMLDRFQADSGLVVYTVKSSTSLADTALQWSINEKSTLRHKLFSSGDADTTYWMSTRDTTEVLIETLQGSHILRSSLLVWSFPCRYPEVEVFRYADSTEFLLAKDYLPPGPSHSGYDSLLFSNAKGLYRQNRYSHAAAIGTYIDRLSVQLLEGPSAVPPSNSAVPQDFALLQNYPNPFNPTTRIGYALPQCSHVRLVVFDALGQQIATVVDGDHEPGYHEAIFDASGFSSGVYFYRLEAGGYMQTRKLILLH